jgi:MoaA/NifB/PqqE/SkfB family radical SAM enzyme/ubiquinone/menaquinone biosynthesis C-methylase UbiE
MSKWERTEYNNLPIYICPDIPDWFVPNKEGDRIFKEWLKNGEISHENKHLLNRINSPEETKYQSRSDKLKLDCLKECWIHITNRCNMECKHCMFKSSPRANEELASQECDNIISESYALGCRLFFFTGGEPFVSKAFIKSVQDILILPHTHVVVLTNLTLISQAKKWLSELPKDRLHFQVSMDGLKTNHDFLRGHDAFSKLKENLATLRELEFPITLSTTITGHNVEEMEGIIDFAAKQDIQNVHFLWLFKKGHADDSLFVEPNRIFLNLTAAQKKAESVSVKIDNIETIRSQVFSCPGTRYDLSNAGWQSLAVGPDGFVYPTPALIYTEDMQSGHISKGIKQVWANSSVLEKIRHASLNQSKTYCMNPFRYIIGGGDIDHSYIQSRKITGADPYVELYTDISKWLIAREANKCNPNGHPAIRLKMGEIIGDCPTEGTTIFFTHSNCVLSLPGEDTHTQINRFYTEAATETKEDILNPTCYEEQLVRHIPKELRYRSYGCGSPVLEADIKHGETVVDLGSGTGIECFIASKLTGFKGRVIGIDMGDTMLGIANTTKGRVVENLHYDNISFKKAFLENIPLDDHSVDKVISNCVINLSPNKRKVFQEIFRVLKPNGSLFISDITYNENIPLEIKYNETLRGECIGGALRYNDLFGLLDDIGFSHSKIVKGYLYRTIKGYDFYSITYQAIKLPQNQPQVLYDFPDFGSTMSAVKTEPTCACFVSPEKNPKQTVSQSRESHRSGCMVCGVELVYFKANQDKVCHYCEHVISANAQCANGHFVCDTCHSADAVEIIKQICLHSRKTDAVTLMQIIRSHPKFPVHGPEHHALLPAVILTALRNSGDDITEEQIITAIQRGQTVAGGACGFLGVCGAAIGVGIAFSLLLGATPLTGDKRQTVQLATQKVLGEIAAYNGPRCCQRDLWIALQCASKLLSDNLGKELMVGQIICEQFSQNKECIHNQCPFWPGKEDAMEIPADEQC